MNGVSLEELLHLPLTLPLSGEGQNTTQANPQTAAAIVDLLDHVTSAKDPHSAHHTLIKELERHLKCQAVLLGLSAPKKIACRLSAASTHYDPQETAAIESAMAECLARGESGIWPAPENAPRHALLAHETLASVIKADCVFSIPLEDRHGKRQGVLIILADQNFPDNLNAQRFLQAATQPLASALGLAHRAKPSWWGRWKTQIASWAKSHKLTAVLIGLMIIAGVLCLPMPYRIACECQLEPVTRRFIAAPFDGTLERAAVEPGDLVEQGQLLAKMDGREIRWELAGLLAEQSQAGKERDGHMAKHDFGAAQLAKLQVERLGLRERLLVKRNENLDIKSPIAGVVVTGDLKKSEGVPLGVGDQLFEIAPLEQMVVEIAIPETDITWTQTGQSVEIVLDAYPETTWTGTLVRIHPRAELREDSQVFIGEVILENPQAVLRPGMRGRAKIEGPEKSLGWNLFHKPWYELRYWLGW